MTTPRPRVALTLGDPAGVGPELAARLLARPESLRAADVYVLANVASPSAKRLAELEALEVARPGRVDIRFDHEPGAAMLNLPEIVAKNSGNDVHFYACGPSPMLDAFEAATKDLPPVTRHLERFNADLKPISTQAQTRYEVVLAKSGMTLQIGPEKSILDTMLDAGIHVEFSCMEGICGSCKIEVIQGIPDHRDAVLSDEERARNDAIFVCCSGSRSERLVLNI